MHEYLPVFSIHTLHGLMILNLFVLQKKTRLQHNLLKKYFSLLKSVYAIFFVFLHSEASKINNFKATHNWPESAITV